MPFSLSSSALNDYQRYLSLLVGNAAFDDIPALTVDYLVIAGGGGGASTYGGGGAGGYREFTAQSLSAGTSYTVTVGAGGAGAASDTSVAGSEGSNSVFNTNTATGGGRGGAAGGATETPSTGGSGGGAGYIGGGGTGANGNEGGYTPAEGTKGGNSSSSGPNYGGGGGGGASVAGSNGTGTTGGNGGDGTASSITGTSVTYAGGGGAGTFDGGTTGSGGAGGGGDAGATGGNNPGQNGTANTGGGGGGGHFQTNYGGGGAGGSGVVILKYPAVYTMTVGAGLGYKTSISGDYKITEFTAGTGTVSFALETADLGPSEDILQEIVLESSASSVTFSGLDAYASEYQHLQIRYVVRTDRVSTVDTAIMRFNNDSSSNYAWHYLRGDGSGVYSVAGASQTYARIGMTSAASSTSDEFGGAVLDILDFSNGSKNTTSRDLSGLTGNSNVFLTSSLWNNTAAVTEIDILPLNGTNFVAGSRFTLIGVK